MTELETKICNFIEKKYEAKFLGKVEVEINDLDYCLNLTLNNYMIPIVICAQSSDDENFYEYITKELSMRDLIRVDYLKLVKQNEEKDN